MSILSSLLGITRGEPTQTIPTGVQTQEIAKEVAPFIKDILGKGQALYKQRMEEGFVPFEGKTLADVTAEQQQAQEGIRGLVGTQAPADKSPATILSSMLLFNNVFRGLPLLRLPAPEAALLSL